MRNSRLKGASLLEGSAAEVEVLQCSAAEVAEVEVLEVHRGYASCAGI
jgi:hypothetical protein